MSNVAPEDVVIFCCWFKRNLFCEDSMCRLWDAGFRKIFLVQTSEPTFGHYKGPYHCFMQPNLDSRPIHDGQGKTLLKYNRFIWRDALLHLHNELVRSGLDYKYVFLMDYDLFLTDTKEFIATINEMSEGQYDHVGRLQFLRDAERYNWGSNYIVNISEDARAGKLYRSGPVIAATYSTGWEFFSKLLWEQFTGDWQELIRIGHQSGMKMGAQRAINGPGECAWDKEWFHLSRLTLRYVVIDSLKLDLIKLCGLQSLPWWGLFAKQEELYGGKIYPDNIRDNLDVVYGYLGGKAQCLQAWNKFVQGTPMEHWKPYEGTQ